MLSCIKKIMQLNENKGITEMTKEEILSSNQTKTWKMQRLFELGLSRNQVAFLVGTNYGFAHNVYTAMQRSGVTTSRTVPGREHAEELFQLRNFRFNHKFGVEIEACGITRSELTMELTNAGIQTTFEGYTHETRGNWKVVTDGSLSGTNTFELVSPILEGTEGLTKLKTAALITKGMDGKVNRTCGLHIHFDARQFDKMTWIRIFKNYAKIESKIDGFMASSRRENQNRYCQSIKGSRIETALNEAKTKTDLNSALRRISEGFGGDRYYKVNIQSFWRHGSIEFRQHQGTLEFTKMQNWILFLARLIEFSKNAELRNDSWEEMGRFLSEEQINYFKTRTRELN